MRIIFKQIIGCIGSLLFLSQPAMSNTTNLQALPPHPRLLLLKGEEAGLKADIAASPFWSHFQSSVTDRCREITKMPPLEYKKHGRRLLQVSRNALYRIFMCSYAYRMTGESVFLDKAEQEMLSVCNFNDWNPDHFLDVAEMSMAVAIGYDWLFDHLSASSRKIIREALVSKGMLPSQDARYNSWLKRKSNWNQVCNAGMTFAAIATAESNRELSKAIIERATESVKIAMSVYAPNGIYPEGYGYWHYGTTFNVLLINALEKGLNTDFGLSRMPGFLNTAYYIQQMLSPMLTPFNYGDDDEDARLNPSVFWFAGKLNDTSLMWNEFQQIEKQDVTTNYDVDRFVPMILIWGSKYSPNAIKTPSNLCLTGQGDNPVFLMRTGWNDSNALYAALKTGSPSHSHSHMDAGSFIYDAHGIRWAMDLGANDYTRLELAGLDIWNMTQESDRWKVFRYSNDRHNTLTINGAKQLVEGKAEIDSYGTDPSFMWAISDLTALYANEVKSAQRGIALVNKAYLHVQDEITTNNHPVSVKWQIATRTLPDIEPDNTICLTSGGQKLRIKMNTRFPYQARMWPGQSDFAYDDANPGISIIGFEIEIPSNETACIQVELLPAGADNKLEKLPVLNQWTNYK